MTLVLATFCAIACARAQSDPAIASAQQALKDQGFYYGEVTGKKDSDTSAALRRYQIRNGLQITGEFSAETLKSLGVKGTVSQAPLPRATPPPTVKRAPQPEPSNLRDDYPVKPEQSRPNGNPSYAEPPPGATRGEVFNGTPYQTAPPETQRRVIINAQTLLARRGYLRGAIDGEVGPDTEFALRAFQTRYGIQSNGRLDRETLAVLGLLPGQRAAGVTAAPRNRVYRRGPQTMTPEGEPVYQGR